jgi:hypothetical protein
VAAVALVGLLLSAPSRAAEVDASASDRGQALFANVGSQDITQAEYQAALARAFRERFYHGRPPAADIEAVRREVADELIDRTLLLQEAGRRGLRPDAGSIDETLAGYDRRYGTNPDWQTRRETMLASLKTRLEEDDLLRRLEGDVRRVAPPSQKQVKAFYEANPDKFTEPKRQRVSVILLRVDPSSPNAAWDAAKEEGQTLVDRLRGGADFSELARIHSSDRSAEQGGDMGYLHQGMLTEGAQQAVDALPVGAVSDPVRVLQGIAIFRVDERLPERRRSFEDVQARARELWLRDQGERAWEGLKARLREATKVKIYDQPAHPSAVE